MENNCFKDVGAPRLLELADILDAADAEHVAKGEPVYDQRAWQHSCGTPACAMGHWVASGASRGRWRFGRAARLLFHGCSINGWYEVVNEFCLNNIEEAERLFGSRGCDNAQNGKQAATFIRDFVFTRLGCI